MVHFLIWLGLLLGIAGLATSVVFAVLAAVAALRFSRGRRRRFRPGFTPAVSLLKPLHGSEPGLEDHLRSFFKQDYPTYEILFCARSGDDAALQAARCVAGSFPHVSVRFLSSGEPPYANAKVWSLEQMYREAAHEILVISDSDVSVAHDYLRRVVEPFARPEVGLVTCLYRGIARRAGIGGSLWSRLEAVGMSIEMTAGVLVASLLEGMKFALGPTMAVRRRIVEEIGGFGVLGSYHADDFMLGNLVAGAGHQVVLSGHVIRHHVLNETLGGSIAHQIRWMKSTRFSRPKGHMGTALTFGMPYALLAGGMAFALGQPEWAVILLAAGWLSRVGLAVAITGAITGAPTGESPSKERTRELRPGLLEGILLYPVRDLLGFVLWSASYLSRKVNWRGDDYILMEDGCMRNRSSADRISGVATSYSSVAESELAAAD